MLRTMKSMRQSVAGKAVMGKVVKITPEKYRDMDYVKEGANELAESETALMEAMNKFRGPLSNDDDEVTEVPENAPLVDKLWFNVLIGILVLLNMVSIGLELDYGYQFTQEEELPPPKGLTSSERLAKRLPWWLMENAFCVLFVVELVLRIRTYRMKFFTEAFNVIDMGLVFAACLDTYILTFLGEAGNLRIVSALRIFRLIRLIRFVRLLKAFKEIWLIFQTLGNSIRALVWVGMLMISILYMFAIFLTSYIGQNAEVYGVPEIDPEKEPFPYKIYFGTVPRSMFTLFQILTLDDWCEGIVRRVAEKAPFIAAIFLIFIILTAYGLLNVIVGVIVENTLSSAKLQEVQKLKQKAREQRNVLQELRELFYLSDADFSGTVSLAEFKASYESDVIRSKFKKLELPGTDAEEVFALLDPMNKGHILLDDFIASCALLIGGADMAKNVTQISLQVETLSRRLDGFDSQLGGLEHSIVSIRETTSDFLQNTLPLITGIQV